MKKVLGGYKFPDHRFILSRFIINDISFVRNFPPFLFSIYKHDWYFISHDVYFSKREGLNETSFDFFLFGGFFLSSFLLNDYCMNISIYTSCLFSCFCSFPFSPNDVSSYFIFPFLVWILERLQFAFVTFFFFASPDQSFKRMLNWFPFFYPHFVETFLS